MLQYLLRCRGKPLPGLAFLIGACLLAGLGSKADAASLSFSGSFKNDNDVELLNFVVGASSNLIIRSYGYAGGTNAAGTTFSAGGFDPIITLFDGSNSLIAQNDDDGTGTVGVDPITGKHYDSYIQASVGPGSYTVALTQYDNFAAGSALLDGFLASSPTFTSAFHCSNGMFCDYTGANRTGQWAFDILNINSGDLQLTPLSVVETPVPATLPLFASGLGIVSLAAGFRRRKVAKSLVSI
jgi:hypothetical protein